MSHKGYHHVAQILLIIGGLNWLALALFDWEIGMLLGGSDEVITQVVYVIIGLAAIYELFTNKAILGRK